MTTDHKELIARLRSYGTCVDSDAADALEAAQAEIAKLHDAWRGSLMMSADIATERDAALARLAGLAKQEPVCKVNEYDINTIDWFATDNTVGMGHKLFAAAGASPTQRPTDADIAGECQEATDLRCKVAELEAGASSQPDVYNAKAYGVPPLSTTPAAQPSQAPDHHEDNGTIIKRFGQLIAAAERAGLVVTLERRPLQPLAMGHAEYVFETRPVRGKP